MTAWQPASARSRAPVAHVADDQFRLRREIIGPSPLVNLLDERIENSDGVTPVQQALRDAASDEAGTAGDQNSFHSHNPPIGRRSPASNQRFRVNASCAALPPARSLAKAPLTQLASDFAYCTCLGSYLHQKRCGGLPQLAVFRLDGYDENLLNGTKSLGGTQKWTVRTAKPS
jgi:hypothetical protein